MDNDFGLFEIIVILAIVGGIGYAVYSYLNGDNGAGGAPDPGGGAPSTTILGRLDNMLEIGSSSESMSDATASVISNPIGAISAIVSGWYDDASNFFSGGVSVTPTEDGSDF